MRIFILYFIIGLPFTASARWLTIKESPSVVTRLHLNFDVKKDGTWSQAVEYNVQVQSEDAKTNASIFTVDYNSVTDKVEILEAYTKNGSKKFNVDPKAIEDRDKGDSRDYDAVKVKSVVYPQVQVGSNLYVRYKITTSRPLMKDRWSTYMTFPPGVYVTNLRIRAQSERPLYYEVHDPEKKLTVKQSNKYTFEVRNRKPLPGWVHAEKDPYFHPDRASSFWLSTEKEWQPFFSDLEADYDKILNVELPPRLRPWVQAAAKLKTAEDKINFVLNKVSEEFRYFGDWRRHDGGFVPRPLKEIETSRYGDCKDLSALVTSLLRALNMNARIALVRRGENPWVHEPDYKLPAAHRFNHAVVFVDIEGQKFWLDATNAVTSVRPFPDISGRPAWIMGHGDSGHFERLPDSAPEDFEHIHKYTYKFNGGDDVDVQVRAQLKKMAPYRLANDLLLTARSQVLSETLEYFSDGLEVRDFKYLKEPKTTRTLSDMNLELDFKSGKVTYNAGASQFWPLPDGFLEGAFYETEGRVSDLRLSEGPYVFSGVRRLVKTKLSGASPPPCHVESKWMVLDRRVKAEGTDIVIEQSVRLLKPVILQSEFKTAEFKKLQADTKACYHRSGLLIQSAKFQTL